MLSTSCRLFLTRWFTSLSSSSRSASARRSAASLRCRRNSARDTASSSSGSTGSTRKLSAPAASELTRSITAMLVADICSTIVEAVAGSDLSCRHTSMPFMSGRLMSRMTSGGRSCARSAALRLPVPASSTLKPARCRMRRGRVASRLVVVDVEDRLRRFWHGRSPSAPQTRCMVSITVSRDSSLLVNNASACAARSWSSSLSRRCEVNSTTGMRRVSSIALSILSTSKPWTSGIIRSRKITSGCAWRASRRPS